MKSIFIRLRSIADPDQFLTPALLLFAAILTVINISSIKYPWHGTVGVAAWIILFIIFTLYAGHNLYQILRRSYEIKSIITISTLLLFFILIGVSVNNPNHVSGETTQQTSCILDHLHSSPDWGFNQLCFLGYPSRQYLIPAIPSLLFGRSQLSLNIGGSIYFVIGMIIFAGSLTGIHKFDKKTDIIIGLCLAFLLHFHHLNHFLYHSYEQSHFPLSLGLIALGFFISYYTNRQLHLIVLFGLSLQYLIFSYTPSLALVFLAILVLIHLFVISKTKTHKFIIITLIVNTAINLVFSINYREDIRIFSAENSTIQLLTQESIKLIEHSLTGIHGKPLVSPYVQFIFYITILIGLSSFLGRRIIIPSLWIVVVITASSLFSGYAFYGIDFRIHRALVIAPVFITILFLLIKKIRFPTYITTLIFIFTLTSGYKFHQNYLNSVQISDQYDLVNQLVSISGLNLDTGKNVFMFEKASERYISIHDFSRYFLPGLTIDRIDSSTYQPECSLTNTGYYILLSTDHCYSTIIHQADLTNDLILHQGNIFDHSDYRLIIEK